MVSARFRWFIVVSGCCSFQLVFSSFLTLPSTAITYFSRNLPKIYKTATLTNFFQFMQSQSQSNTHPVMLFNPLMPMVIKGYAYFNKPACLVKTCMTFRYHHAFCSRNFQGIITQNQEHSASCLPLKNCSEDFIGKFLENHLQQSKYWKLITMLNVKSVADIFIGVSRKYSEQLF